MYVCMYVCMYVHKCMCTKPQMKHCIAKLKQFWPSQTGSRPPSMRLTRTTSCLSGSRPTSSRWDGALMLRVRMCVCMYVFLYIYIYVYIYIYIHIYMYVHSRTSSRWDGLILLCECTCVCVYIYIYIFVYIYSYIHLRACMDMYVQPMHRHTRINIYMAVFSNAE
jgi:hypothetical protein